MQSIPSEFYWKSLGFFFSFLNTQDNNSLVNSLVHQAHTHSITYKNRIQLDNTDIGLMYAKAVTATAAQCQFGMFKLGEWAHEQHSNNDKSQILLDLKV